MRAQVSKIGPDAAVGGVHREVPGAKQQCGRNPALSQTNHRHFLTARAPAIEEARPGPRRHRTLSVESATSAHSSPEDVEAGHHRGLGPSQLLEMMVQRSHAKDPVGIGVLPPAGALEPLVGAGLEQHRERLRGKHATDQQQEKLRLEQDRHRAQRAADRQAAGVAHEHLGGMRVEPEKTDRGPHECRAEDRQLAGARADRRR